MGEVLLDTGPMKLDYTYYYITIYNVQMLITVLVLVTCTSNKDRSGCTYCMGVVHIFLSIP